MSFIVVIGGKAAWHSSAISSLCVCCFCQHHSNICQYIHKSSAEKQADWRSRLHCQKLSGGIHIHGIPVLGMVSSDSSCAPLSGKTAQPSLSILGTVEHGDQHIISHNSPYIESYRLKIIGQLFVAKVHITVMTDPIGAGINLSGNSHSVPLIIFIGNIRGHIWTSSLCIIVRIQFVINLSLPVTHNRFVFQQPRPGAPTAVIDMVILQVHF